MSDRLRAMVDTQTVLVTVWVSEMHRLYGGEAMRWATQSVTVSDAAGRSLVYMGAVDPRIMVTDTLSTAPQALSVTVPWLSDFLAPDDMDWSEAVGEVAIVWTDDPWEQRYPKIYGRADIQWGTDRDPLRITVQDKPLRPRGQLWPKGAELSVSRFPDIGSDAARGRARYSAGLLPPICYAPIGSGMYAPILCVVDEVSAVAGVSDLVPRRYIVSQRPQASQGSIPLANEQLRLVDPERDGGYVALSDAVEYQAPLLKSTDADGGRYVGVLGDFVETFGASSVTFSTSDEATATKVRRKMAPLDQVRYTGDGDDDWAVALSMDGSTVELDRTYAGTGGVDGTGDVIRLPAEKGYPGYRILTLGGDALPSGDPITNVCDVLVDMLSKEQIGLPLALGDIESMRSRLAGIDISSILTERVHPWDWVSSRIFALLPIRPYRHNGVIHFAWVGPVSPDEVAARIDLDEMGPAYRMEPLRHTGADIYPAVRLRYWWDVPRETYRYALLQDSSRAYDGGLIDTWVATGRSVSAAARWRAADPARTDADLPTFEAATDAIETRTAAGLVSTWLLYATTQDLVPMRLEIGRELAWAQPGTALEVTEQGVTRQYRVEQRSFSPIGVGYLLLQAATT